MGNLRVIKIPAVKKETVFQDANDILSSSSFAKHERREPTENEKNQKRKGHYTRTNKNQNR